MELLLSSLTLGLLGPFFLSIASRIVTFIQCSLLVLGVKVYSGSVDLNFMHFLILQCYLCFNMELIYLCLSVGEDGVQDETRKYLQIL